MDEADKAGLADAMQRLGEALKAEDWDAAGEAFLDADTITDRQTGEAEEKTPAPEEKGKKPLAAIIIGGPKK